MHGVPSSSPLLSVRDLVIHFGDPARPVRAVDGVSFEVGTGEVVALVGESGCGKSVTAMALARLLPEPAARYVGGSIQLLGRDVLAASDSALRAMRGADIAYVFQEPAAALNPVFTIGFQIGEVLRAHRRGIDEQAELERLLRAVGLDDVQRVARAYPHELSGGMQQRAVIAMALAGAPRLLVADEPTTALDVTVQAQVLEVLQAVQRAEGMGMLFITHNLGLVKRIAHRVLVMYAGQLVEAGPVTEVLRAPRHPYTKALLRAVPRLRGPVAKLEGIPGTVPAGSAYPSGCRFHPRCPHAEARCRAEEPAWAEGDGVRCHLWRSLS
ncbi:MAG TPA: ABC transporter ATP-binding protein [Kiritimatiellia bacterium]|nr:ABC transporter ATP-binding protein [Kiritimatiellia bacterium]